MCFSALTIIYIHIIICVHKHTHARTHARTHTYAHTATHKYTHIQTHTRTYARTYVRMYVCITILFVFSVEGGDQQCCYGPTGELLPYAKGGGSVSRFSATHQPLLYMLRDFWPRIMCDQLANKTSVTQQLRPTDDCSGYVPPKQGAWNCGFK